MPKKSRWTLLFLGLSTGALSLPLQAEPKPSILESWGLPPVFKSSESSSAPSAPAAPSRSRTSNDSVMRPGSLMPRKATKPAGTAQESSSELFPALRNFGEMLGIESTASKNPIGKSADGIVAPPPPTLEATADSELQSGDVPIPEIDQSKPSELKTTKPAMKPPATSPSANQSGPAGNIAAAVPNKRPSIPELKTKPAEVAAAIPEETLAEEPAAEMIVKKEAPKSTPQSSRRAWRDEGNTYTSFDDGSAPPALERAALRMTELVDRRVADKPAEATTNDDQSRAESRPAFDQANPPVPVVFGQEDAAERQRFSTAARMSRSVVTQLPAASSPETSPINEVKPASYLPPIISAEEARRLKESRRK